MSLKVKDLVRMLGCFDPELPVKVNLAFSGGIALAARPGKVDSVSLDFDQWGPDDCSDYVLLGGTVTRYDLLHSEALLHVSPESLIKIAETGDLLDEGNSSTEHEPE